ncbi:hypothetical protein BDN67DRAFT_963409 [Paxillus ammoniavirescens]|nr:hypothetical protein BDN67DRAFT_963409 [Paxillus ammoniavirescens]
MSPRSILKHPKLSGHTNQQHFPDPFPFAPCSSVRVSPHVHFPPTPTLTSTFTTHSPSTYDRTSVVVAPNNCALPGRHEREFIETSYSHYSPDRYRVDNLKGSYFHPRAFEACSIEPSGYPPPAYATPPLIPDTPYDTSSESDDSDGRLMTPPDPISSTPPISVHFSTRHTSNPMIPYSHSQEQIESAFSFLPHAHPSSSKEKQGVRRSHTHHGRTHHSDGSRKGNATNRIRDHSHFAVPSLDSEGCLGGF